MRMYKWFNPFNERIEEGDLRTFKALRERCRADDRKNGRYRLFDTHVFKLVDSVLWFRAEAAGKRLWARQW